MSAPPAPRGASPPPPPPRAELSATFLAAASVVAYSVCSASLLLVNKIVLARIPSAPLVTAVQCVFCVAAIGGSAVIFGTPRLDAPTAPLLRAYGAYTVLFVAGIYANMRSLEGSNVDTVVVFRATVPLLVAAGDWALLGREAPSARSLASMLVVLAGCAAFVAVDAQFAAHGAAAYAWLAAYVAAIAAEMLLGKQITASLGASLGTSVLLTNALAVVPFLAIGAATGELQRGVGARGAWAASPGALTALAASCVLSAGIGFSSWWCRSLTSATTFTVVGTVNKVLTVLVNIAVWDKHASAVGTGFLLVCLAAGALYQQAPMRAQPGYAKVAGSEEGEGK
jgi:hypothetical protein